MSSVIHSFLTPRRSKTTKRSQPKFALVYALAFLINLQAFLVSYTNSTYLEQFTTPEVIGLLYTIGSCISIFAFLFISRVLRKVGNTICTLIISVLTLLTLTILSSVTYPPLVIIVFVLFLTLGPLLYMSIDVFSEALIGDNESSTGSKRGLALSIMSLAGALGPFIVALIMSQNSGNLSHAYLAASLVGGLFITLILAHFRHFNDPPYSEVKVLKTLRSFFEIRSIRTVFMTHLSLQMFFAWTVIYIPLYMATEIGMTWDAIGIVLGVGLLTYVIFEWPIGYLADNHFGEKEMMALRFLIIIVTLSWLSFIDSKAIMVWIVLTFLNRVGASLVEVTTESYFFKHTKGTDANLISFFRITRPLGVIIGSLVGSATLLFLPFNLIFVAFGLVLIPAMILTLTLEDTR